MKQIQCLTARLWEEICTDCDAVREITRHFDMDWVLMNSDEVHDDFVGGSKHTTNVHVSNAQQNVTISTADCLWSGESRPREDICMVSRVYSALNSLKAALCLQKSIRMCRIKALTDHHRFVVRLLDGWTQGAIKTRSTAHRHLRTCPALIIAPMLTLWLSQFSWM